MKHLFILLMFCGFAHNCWAQDQSDSTKLANTQDSLRTVAAESHPKLFEKLVEVEQDIEAAVAEREEVRKQAEASTEPEAYSDVAKMSIKISKLQTKLTYAQQKLNNAMMKERKSKEKEDRKNKQE